MFHQRLVLFVCCLSLIFGNLLSLEQELLKASDINKVMQQIFAQHVDKKNISAPILKHAFGIYIDQFDPYRTYLLEEEVAPYLNMSERRIAQVMAQYRAAQFYRF